MHSLRWIAERVDRNGVWTESTYQFGPSERTRTRKRKRRTRREGTRKRKRKRNRKKIRIWWYVRDCSFVEWMNEWKQKTGEEMGNIREIQQTRHKRQNRKTNSRPSHIDRQSHRRYAQTYADPWSKPPSHFLLHTSRTLLLSQTCSLHTEMHLGFDRMRHRITTELDSFPKTVTPR